MRKLTRKERSAINRVKKAAEGWPDTLWAFASESGRMTILKVDENGEQAMTKSGCVDQDYIVDEIDIPCEGGAW